MSTFAQQTSEPALMAAFPTVYAASRAASALRERHYEVDLIGETPVAAASPVSRNTTNALTAGAAGGFAIAIVLPLLLGISVSLREMVVLLALAIPGAMAVGAFLAGSGERPTTIRDRVLQREALREDSGDSNAFLMVSASEGSDIAGADEILRRNGAIDITRAV